MNDTLRLAGCSLSPRAREAMNAEGHGILVKLCASVSTSSEDITRQLWRVRHAIDLVKLALVVDPCAIKSFPERDAGSNTVDISSFAGREVPFEVRVQLNVTVKFAVDVQQTLVDRFMKELDERQVDESDVLRRYLVDQAVCSRLSRRLIELPVKTTLVFVPNKAHAELHPSFFECVAMTSKALDVYQGQRSKKWVVAKLYAPLFVRGIYLELDVVPLESSVLNAATAFKESSMVVSSSSITLDFQTISCTEEELDSLLRSIMTVGGYAISTGKSRGVLHDHADVSLKIVAMMRCIGQLPGELSLDLTGLMASFQKAVNRQAVFYSLVNYILPRGSNVQLDILDGTQFDHEDARSLRHEVSSWRRKHSNKKLRLDSLDLDVESIAFVSALLRALDDVEVISLSLCAEDLIDEEDMTCMLRYPSLRELSVRNISIPSMDIFHSSSSSGSPELHLESLELSSLVYIGRFFESGQVRAES